MPQVVLDEPGVRPLVGERVAAGVAQHVGVRLDGQLGQRPVAPDRHPGGPAVERRPPLGDEERVARRPETRPLGEPGLDGPQLVAPKRVRGRQPLLQPGHVQHPALEIDLVQFECAGLGHPQPVAEHQEDQAAVAQLGAAAAGGRDQALDLAWREVFAVVHRFVQCLAKKRGAKPRRCWGWGLDIRQKGSFRLIVPSPHWQATLHVSES